MKDSRRHDRYNATAVLPLGVVGGLLYYELND